MKKRIRFRINSIFSSWRCRLFLLLFICGLCFALTANQITNYFRDQEPNINEALQEYLTSSFSSNINNLYIYDIDKRMEDFMNSSAVTGFFFCSEQYPAADDLISYLESQLTYMADHSDYITAAALYASASNTCVFSQTDNTEASELHELLNDMIYNYNSNAFDKNKLTSDGFNTFLFKYEDYVVFSKDLTTLSGSSYSTMFFLMDPDAFSSFIYRANGMIPYKASIYDSHNVLLFTNSNQSKEENYSRLISFSTDEVFSAPSESSIYIYTSSDVTGLQYLLEMEQLPLSGSSSSSPFILVICAMASLLLSWMIFEGLHHKFRIPLTHLRHTAEHLELSSGSSPSDLAAQTEKKVSSLIMENTFLKNIIEATSAEALAHLFTRLITGENIEAEEAQITLRSTKDGFRIDDIYIAGIIHQNISDFIPANNRVKILNMLNSVFDKFKEKNQCALCAFLYDEKSIVIIASFPAGTSIAKGKARINALTQQINEGSVFLNLPMFVAFGHMYSSILDLSFSYNEAFKSMHYQVATFLETAGIARDVSTDENAAVSEEPPSADETSEISDISDTAEQIDHRAAQIAELIWENKEEGLPSLISRTLRKIFEAKELSEQENLSRRLISAVTSHMLSYPFVNDRHLSNVYDDLSILIQNGTDSDSLQECLRTSLSTLCQDFSNTLKKQRNPYITASQEYIESHYSNPDLSLEEIAESLKIAPNYLSTIFSKNLGIKLFEYVNEYRLEKSIDLLLHTDKTVNDISIECGFGSSRNYIRIFKKHKDNTPGAYRKQQISVHKS